jgi:hypothetical protein
MSKIALSEIKGLVAYEKAREDMRAGIIEVKRARRVAELPPVLRSELARDLGV